MELINSNSKINNQGIVLCLGTFDGLHMGHMKLIEYGQQLAKQNGYKVCVHSFDNIPANLFCLKPQNISIFNHDEKIEAFENVGIDYLWLDQFTKEVSGKSCHEYIKYLSSVLDIKHIVVGFNYSFGKNAAGHTFILSELGKEFGFDLSVIDPIKIEDVIVSSSEIRKRIAQGDIRNANIMLQRRFYITGEVAYGKQYARKIDFPTINLIYDGKKILPKFGVYATKTIICGKEYQSITNVGDKPTFKNDNVITIETHIFDFEDMCYGEKARVEFLQFVRDEQTFDGLLQLKQQIEKDIEQVMNILNKGE